MFLVIHEFRQTILPFLGYISMKAINLIFPHQLFEESPLLNNGLPIYLVEEYLFFSQYKFHQQKIAFHRATMQFYKNYLEGKGIEVHYVESSEAHSDVRKLMPFLQKEKVQTVHYVDVTDNWLNKRLTDGAATCDIELQSHPSNLFLNTLEDLEAYYQQQKKFYQTNFYIYQRKKRQILVEDEDKPIGGKWSYDAENRKKYPRKKTPPFVQFPDINDFVKEARNYTKNQFSEHYGTLTDTSLYPTTFDESRAWLQRFLEQRFIEFGPYEDAIVADEIILHHSVLTPMLNVGLLTPKYIIDTTLEYASENEIPLASLEGFIRQIIGWREFIRYIYEYKGTEERNKNFWNFERKIPESFWDGTTGIPPIDTTIKKLLKTGYSHHIERLMVLGNFMLLCEFDPDEVYRWFMEMYIDAYDWVMVPNIYGMSQYSDGGIFSTKPYISGSNYLMKMSNYKKGDWQKTWDGLFWRFMSVHREFFLKNYRLSMLVRMFDKMPEEKQTAHLQHAEAFLQQLDQ